MTSIVGAQGRLPQNTPQWHIDYFTLMLLKKRPMQEGHSDPPLCLPESRKQISLVQGALSLPGGRKTSLSSKIGNSGPISLYKQTFNFRINLPPKHKICLNVLLIKHPNKRKFLFSLSLFFFFGLTHVMQMSSGQGSNLLHSSDLTFYSLSQGSGDMDCVYISRIF